MWRMVEYQCSACGVRFESLETVPLPDKRACERCARPAELVISAPCVQSHSGQALYDFPNHGGHDDPPPGCLDTRPMVEGDKPVRG